MEGHIESRLVLFRLKFEISLLVLKLFHLKYVLHYSFRYPFVYKMPTPTPLEGDPSISWQCFQTLETFHVLAFGNN